MKLFLASEAKHPQSFEKLQEFVGGCSGKKLAYIPTAANGEGWGSWKDGGSWKLLQTLDAEVSLVQLEEYQMRDPFPDLQNKDIIWMAGGSCGYLLYWLRRMKLETRLTELLQNGTVYIGSSAGAMITSSDMSFCEWYVGEEEPGAGIFPGLGLVDFQFYPHYQDDHLPTIQQNFSGKKMYLVKDGEAVVVDGDQVSVFGEERVLTRP